MQAINWNTPVDVYCVNVGEKYGPEYVFKLKSAVERHLTQPHNFWCITDKPELYPFSIQSDDLPGYWSKISVFKLFIEVHSFSKFCAKLNFVKSKTFRGIKINNITF